MAPPRTWATMEVMAGAVVMIVILVVVFPIVFLMSMAVLAAILGALVNGSVDADHEGSELLVLADANPYRNAQN